MARSRLTLATLGCWLLATACATTAVEPTAQQRLQQAEALVQAGNFDAALYELSYIAKLQCPKRLRDRRDLTSARAEFGRGKPWQAFLDLEEFSDQHPHSSLRGDAVDLLWRIGKTLTESDGGFLFFWSDQRAGRTVLEHLITRHPDTQRLADALRILGDMAFASGDFERAQDRYRDIILNRPESDWRFYAQFRFAMSIVASLQGPDYDLARMEHAVRELRMFLSNKPESPQMVAETEGALRQLLEWQVDRHLQIAEFYRTVGSTEGERHHLDLATREEFQQAPAYERAVDARSQFAERIAEQPTPAAGGRP